jgi:hypothetical protein
LLAGQEHGRTIPLTDNHSDWPCDVSQSCPREVIHVPDPFLC